MREILFRGKRIDDGAWVYGYLVRHKSGKLVYIYSAKENWFDVHMVIPETVGQFTGLTAHGKKIFEGDILEWDLAEYGRGYRERVNWSYALFSMRQSDWREWCEVIGNIHDNPELLEVE